MMLDEIVQSKRREIAQAKQRLPLEELKTRVASYHAARNFRDVLAAPGKLSLIAELKRKSPSKGMLRERFDPVSLAQTMEEAGAAALSVLTDEPFFGGHLDFLRDAKQFTEVPVLRKDFILEPYQIYEAAVYEADAVLLIVRLLPQAQLRECLDVAHRLGMEALVEVHAQEELATALAAGARILGINHRDLQTFQMDMTLSERLIPRIPSGCVIVAESGIQTPEDVQRMQRLGVHALLIGESLMVSPDVSAKIRQLFAGTW